MSGPAQSVCKENNAAWLNNLVGDIVDSTYWTSRTNQDNEATDNLDSDIESQSALSRYAVRRQPPSTHSLHHKRSSISRRSLRSPVFNGYSHYSYRPTAVRISSASPAETAFRSAPMRDVSSGSSSVDSRPLRLDPFHEKQRHPSSNSDQTSSRTAQESSPPPISFEAYSRPLGLFVQKEATLPSRMLHKSISSPQLNNIAELTAELPSPIRSKKPVVPSRTPHEITATRTSPPRVSGPLRTSLERARSEETLSEKGRPSLACTRSVVSEGYTGSRSHPALTLSSGREALWDAPKPVNDNANKHTCPGPFALALIVLGLCLSVFVISSDRSLITTAIPQITETFQTFNDIGWYGSAYFLAASAFQPLYGRIYVSFDVKWTFSISLAIFEIGSLFAALAPTSKVLILGRAVQGFGSAGVLTGSFVIGTHSVPIQSRPILLAFIGVLYAVGALAGPLLGGVLTDLLTWRWIFWINLPIGVLTFIPVFFFYKPPRNKNQAEGMKWLKRVLHLDLVGNAILLAACLMLFFALELSQSKGDWSDASVVGLLCGAGITMVLFIGWMAFRGDRALIPPRIICRRMVAAPCSIAFFLYGAFLIHAYYLPIWFQAIKGTSAIQSGMNMIPYMLTNAICSLIAGIYVSKNGLFAAPTILGTAIATVGCGLLATNNASTSTWTWISYEVLVSAGVGITIQQAFSAVQAALPSDEVSIGIAAVVASQSLGGAIFLSIGDTVLQSRLFSHSADAAFSGIDIRAVFGLGATSFRSSVPTESLPALTELYNHSLQGVFITAIPLVGIAFLCSFFMEWRSPKVEKGLPSNEQQIEKS